MTISIWRILFTVAIVMGLLFTINWVWSKYETETLVVSSNCDVPEPYYNDIPQKFGLDNLREYLSQIEWRRAYKANEFDCSEMSALLEYRLENIGFNTWIIIGHFGDIPHAWLETEIAIGQYVVVEATNLSVSSGVNYSPHFRYEDIYQAILIAPEAFDWWVSANK